MCQPWILLAFSGTEAIVGELADIRIPWAAGSPSCWVHLDLLLHFDGSALGLVLVRAVLEHVVKVEAWNSKFRPLYKILRVHDNFIDLSKNFT